ncbi:hypothetical protein [Streptomyces sp. NBC_00887]|nr:hypothetical protein OG844_01445 [Streptomyces sp. NBC_00887]WSY36177.1 hypothetical protein OG844_44155 [Streptomyces sp. NBC_00887]
MSGSATALEHDYEHPRAPLIELLKRVSQVRILPWAQRTIALT